MKWMIDTFKKSNAEWERVHVLMADKDIEERDILKQCLPNACVLICLFHTLWSFRREITCEKLGLSSGQRFSLLELLQKMAYSLTETEYHDLYTQLQRDSPKEVVKYVSENWHPNKDEWVMVLKASCGSFLNTTNNRLESINGKLKQVISQHSSLEDFISNSLLS